MKFYYVLWSMVLSLPVGVRFLLEMGVGIFLLWLAWPVLRLLARAGIRILEILNTALFGGFRYLLVFLGHGNEKAYEWDEKLGKTGRNIRDRLSQSGKNIQTNKKRIFLYKKATWVILVLVYLLSLLPYSGMDRFINLYYLEDFYFVNRFFTNMEETLTKGKDHYPELFVGKKQSVALAGEDAAAEAEAASGGQEFYLTLNEATSYANVREEAGTGGRAFCKVSKEDVLVYQNEAQEVEGRLWLKVKVVSQDDKIGWISTKVLPEDVVQELGKE